MAIRKFFRWAIARICKCIELNRKRLAASSIDRLALFLSIENIAKACGFANTTLHHRLNARVALWTKLERSGFYRLGTFVLRSLSEWIHRIEMTHYRVSWQAVIISQEVGKRS